MEYKSVNKTIPNIISALKINISMSLIGVIMGEFLVSKEGIGYLINYGSQVFNLNLVITSVFILGIISYLLYIIIDKIDAPIFITMQIGILCLLAILYLDYREYNM